MITAYIHSLFWQRLSGSRQKHPHARLPHTGAERRMPRVAVSCVAGAGPFWMWCALCLYCSIFRRFFKGKFGGLCSGAARYLLKRGETRRGKIPSWLLTGNQFHDKMSAGAVATAGGWPPALNGGFPRFGRKGEMLMVTYAELFQFCLVILGVVALVLDATKRNNRHPEKVMRLFP